MKCTCTYAEVIQMYKDQGIDPSQYNFLPFQDQMDLHIKWGLCPGQYKGRK